MNQDERLRRRLKIAYVKQDFFLYFLNSVARHEFIALPVTEEIPPGTEIVRVHEDYQKQSWAIVLRHPDFHEVRDGCEIPCIDSRCIEWEEWQRKPAEETHARSADAVSLELKNTREAFANYLRNNASPPPSLAFTWSFNQFDRTHRMCGRSAGIKPYEIVRILKETDVDNDPTLKMNTEFDSIRRFLESWSYSEINRLVQECCE